MKHLSKLLILLLVSQASFSQKNVVFKKSFPAEKIQSFKINSRNAYLKLKTSEDNSIHFDFSIEFNNYDSKDRIEILDGITTSMVKKGDAYYFDLKSESELNSFVYSLNSGFGLFFDNTTTNTTDGGKRRFKNSKKGLKNTILMDKQKQGKMLLMFKRYKENGEIEDINFEEEKYYKVSFEIRIPKGIKLEMYLKDTELDLVENYSDPIFCLGKNSNLTFRELSNSKNRVELEGGSIKALGLKGGNYSLNGLSKVVLVEIEDLELDTEFTDLSIGEVRANVSIKDYNSEYWLYSFSKDLGELKINSEYSKLNIYYPKEKEGFLLTTYGMNTLHYIGKMKTVIPPNRKNESSNMMTVGDPTAPNTMKIDVNIRHGIIRLGNDFIEIMD